MQAIPLHFGRSGASNRLSVYWAAAVSALTAISPAWAQDRPAMSRAIPSLSGRCESCDLAGRTLVGARMTSGVFTGADFSRARLQRVNAAGSAFDSADFTRADMSFSKLSGATFTGAVFDGAYLAHADASAAVLRNAKFTRADVTGVLFQQSNLEGAVFQSATASGAQFLRSNLRHSDFRRANLTGANLTGADVTGAAFQGAILAGADFSNVRGFQPKLLKDACGDAETKLPAGVTLKTCAKS